MALHPPTTPAAVAGPARLIEPPTWRLPPGLADLEPVCQALGTPDFGAAVFRFWQQFLPLDHHACMVYRTGPGYDCLYAGGTLVSTRLAQDLADLYCSRYYRLDPVFERVTRYRTSDDLQIMHLDMHSVPSSQYKRVFWRRFGFGDRCSLSFRRNERTFCVNLYRSTKIHRFSAAELALMLEVGRLLSGLFFAHYQLQRPDERLGETAVRRLAIPTETARHRPSADGHREQVLASLSRHESIVLKLVLTGMSTEAIALDQEISINTVKTYRKRIYRKLGVSTLNELHSRYGSLA